LAGRNRLPCRYFCIYPASVFSFETKNSSFGVVITASHNPPQYNGYKLKANFGGPATPADIAALEAELKKITQRPPKFNFKSYEHYVNNRRIRLFDARSLICAISRKKSTSRQ
jgi:phosphomannomutase